MIEEGQVIGRIYDDRHTPPEYKLFWSLTEHVDPALGITTNGRMPTLEEAKAGEAWSKWRAASKQKEQQQP